MIECIICNEHFSPSNNHQTTCSQTCLRAKFSKLKLKKCKKCNNNFVPLSKNSVYCDSCRYKKRVVKVNCNWCGKEFVKNTQTKIYCSKKCNYESAYRSRKK